MRTRLVLTSTVAMAVLACVLGALLHELIRADLYDSLDQSLETRAKTLTALVEQDEDGVQLEWTDPEDMERARPALPAHFVLRTTGGDVITAEGDVLSFEWPSPDDTIFGSTTLEDGTPVRYAIVRFTPKPDKADIEPAQFDLFVAEPSSHVERTLSDLRFRIVAVGLGGIVLGGGLLFLIVSHETAPLKKLAGQIGKLDANFVGARIEFDRAPSELRPVVIQLNELLERLDAARTRERDFTAGAAHELRTPLAGIRAKLNLALSQERSAAEHRAFAQECLEITVGIQGVVERLLSLTRLEAGEVLGERRQVNLRGLVGSAWNSCADRAAERKVTVELAVPGEDVVVHDEALGVVLGNLLENAVNYSEAGRAVHVEYNLADRTLSVSNPATGMTKDDARRALEPFWRSDKARSKAGVHAGLGLTLCRRLVEAMGGKFDVRVSDGRFVARVRLNPQ